MSRIMSTSLVGHDYYELLGRLWQNIPARRHGKGFMWGLVNVDLFASDVVMSTDVDKYLSEACENYLHRWK